MKSSYITTPMNYIGGKSKLLPQILPLFPKKIDTFVDIFCGGCNVGINASAETIILNDNLTYLIELYECFLRTDKEEVLRYIENRIAEFNLSKTNSDGYLALRNAYNTNRIALDLFVLIAYSFNHQIRFNTAHEYNNPFGKERSSYNEKMKSNLISFLDTLSEKNIIFSNCDFRTFDYSILTEKDFLYVDPPYLITTGTYNDGKRGFSGWNVYTERELLKLLSTLSSKGIRFALSNVLEHKGKENLLLKEWIEENGLYTYVLEKSYQNSNYQSRGCEKGKTLEVLVTNYDTNSL